jgi:hypothetical protein
VPAVLCERVEFVASRHPYLRHDPDRQLTSSSPNVFQ